MRSRTIKVLVALLAAMTVAAFLLILISSDPIRPPVANLAALLASSEGNTKVVTDIEAPLQGARWHNIVIHSTTGERRDVEGQCHFIIDSADAGGAIRRTNLWNNQKPGKHFLAGGAKDYNADSIGICIRGDFSRNKPTSQQFQNLVSLVQALQRICTIGGDNVYLSRNLDPQSKAPGDAFPDETFRGMLVRF